MTVAAVRGGLDMAAAGACAKSTRPTCFPKAHKQQSRMKKPALRWERRPA